MQNMRLSNNKRMTPRVFLRQLARGSRPTESSIPDWLRIWELSTLSLSAWAVAGTAGYFLCALPPRPPSPAVLRLTARSRRPPRADIRPKWYPDLEYRKADTFTPKEVADWNQGKIGPEGEKLAAKR